MSDDPPPPRLPVRWRHRLGRLLLGLVAVVLLTPPVVFAVYRFVPVPVTPLMLLRLADGAGLSKDWVPLERMDPALPRAVVAAEDNLFCSHHGFDVGALDAAVRDYMAGASTRGASTISMQTAKNVLLWPGRTLLRKGMEAYATLWLEVLWPKRRIIEVYLNVAEWAPGVYGAEAAARHHFDRSAADLSPRQAALLAAVLPNPREWSAGHPGAYVERRAAILQRRVGQLGHHLDCLP